MSSRGPADETRTVDFFNEVSLLYGIVADGAAQFERPGEGFPPGFEYLWCSAPQYVDHVMTWVEDQINKEDIFPTTPGEKTENTTYESDFKKTAMTIFKRLFRVFAIIYCSHFDNIEQLGAAAHLNTSFKHFIFFALEFDLLARKEMDPLEALVTPLVEEFNRGTMST
eukprot:jgi/Undpi1/1399/HiC_scaffold_11.g04791.m1